MRQLCLHVDIIVAITVSDHFIFIQCFFIAHFFPSLPCSIWDSFFPYFFFSLFLWIRFVSICRINILLCAFFSLFSLRLQVNLISFKRLILLKLPFSLACLFYIIQSINWFFSCCFCGLSNLIFEWTFLFLLLCFSR